MPATAGSTTFARLKQKMGRSPSQTNLLTISLKPLKYSRISQLTPASRRKIRGQLDRPVAQAHEPAHRMAERLEQAPHLAVAALFQHHPVPAIAAFALAVGFNFLEPRGSAVELYAFK